MFVCAVILLLVFFVSLLVSTGITVRQECKDAGGVLVDYQCISKEAILTYGN